MKRMMAWGLMLTTSAGTVMAEPLSSALDGITVDGFVSVGYTYNFNKPLNDLNGFRLFDEDINTFNIDVAELVFQKPVANEGDAGFRIDITAGGAIPEKAASVGLNLNGVGEVNVDLQQAYASYIMPIGTGIRWDFGKFITHMGYEVIEGYDGYNDHYSRSLSFNYAIPFTHTGVRAGYTFTDWLAATAVVVNGWDQVEDVNNSKSVGAQVILKPIKSLTLTGNWVGGPEQVRNNDGDRNVYEAIATWTPHEDWTFAALYTHGEEDSVSISSRNRAEWDAIGGYIKYDLTERLALAFRGEKFEDDDGARFALGQATDITSWTFTPTWRVTDNFIVRAEGRWDDASRNIFVKENGTDDQQTTVAANVIYTF